MRDRTLEASGDIQAIAEGLQRQKFCQATQYFETLSVNVKRGVAKFLIW